MKTYSDYFRRIEETEGFEPSGYKKKIRRDHSKDKMKNLFTNCFGHHVRYHNFQIKSLKFDDEDSERFIKEDVLSALFVNKYYQLPEIYAADDGEENIIVDYEEVLNSVLSHPFSEDENPNNLVLGSNRIRFVVGDVGTGKSSFIRRLLSDVDEKSTRKKFPYYNLNVYIDCEDLLNSKSSPRKIGKKFWVALFEAMKGVVYGCLPRALAKEIEILERSAQKDPHLAIKVLSRDMKEMGYRFSIYLDNLDFYHYYFSRYAFFEEYKKNQEEAIFNNLNGLINAVRGDGYLGHSGLVFVLAIRDTVWDEIVNKDPGVATRTNTMRGFRLQTPTHNQIVLSRIRLFSDACEFVRDNSDGEHSDLKNLSLEYEKLFLQKKSGGASVVDTIYELGQHGFRSLVDFFSSLRISPSEVELFNRFFIEQKTILINLYINRMHRKYSQAQDHFPNIFLVDARVCAKKKFPNAYREHIHTYWLKYIVLSIVCNSNGIRVGELIQKLCIKECGYEEHLVRLIIGSLSTPNEFRCIEIDQQEVDCPMDRLVLRATSRGRKIMGQSFGGIFVFSYQYLASIVDDRWLAFPRGCASAIFQKDLDFQHLFYLADRYHEHGTGFVVKRFYLVLKFIKILKYAWNYEMEKYREGLLLQIYKDIAIPNFSEIESYLVSSVEKILKAYGEKIDAKVQSVGLEPIDVLLNEKESVHLANAKSRISAYYASPCGVV